MPAPRAAGPGRHAAGRKAAQGTIHSCCHPWALSPQRECPQHRRVSSGGLGVLEKRSPRGGREPSGEEGTGQWVTLPPSPSGLKSPASLRR